MRIPVRSLLVLAGLAILSVPASAVTIDWVTVGDPGNANDAPFCRVGAVGFPCGSVAYTYAISKYEVTNAQYAEFLNAKAAADPLELYSSDMGSHAQGGITRTGSAGSYSYEVKPGFANKPVNFVSVYDALRFANWLNNGQSNGDTETGSYTLLGGTATPSVVTRNPDANIVLPNANEWHKAAYYDGLSATYFNFPAESDSTMTCAAPTATPNRANCGNAAGGLTDVGSYPGSASPYGTFDQGGNVAEWLDGNLLGNWPSRGGSYSDAVSTTGAHAQIPLATMGSSSRGFRVVSLVPEPGTALLFLLGLAGLASRRRIA